MIKIILAFFLVMGGCVRLIILMVKQTGKRKGMRESSSSVPMFFAWACPLFVSSFFFRVFRRAKAGDNVVPRAGVKSRKKNAIFSPLL